MPTVQWVPCKKDSSESTCKIEWPDKDVLLIGKKLTHWVLGTYRNGYFTSDDGRIKLRVHPSLVEERIEAP